VLDDLLVAPGRPSRLSSRDAGDHLGLGNKQSAAPVLATLLEEMQVLQNRLWAERSRSLLVVLQGMDASGKDGTIRRVLSGVDPQGCSVTSFKVPCDHESDHDYLWRVHAACPAHGEIGIFNRSHYEDVVTTHVSGLIDEAERRRRLRHVRDFERMLGDEGTTIVKLFLHVSKTEQRKRLQARLDDPEKRWKFRVEDLDARGRWEDYQQAYEEAIDATSTGSAPWYVVPADHRWVRDFAVASTLTHALGRIDPHIPDSPEGLAGVTVE
jgi:PPK2 family polyphosphate:nucleotide phosphotransferase